MDHNDNTWIDNHQEQPTDIWQFTQLISVSKYLNVIPMIRSTLQPGESFQAYRILKLLGKGAFGEVYLVQKDGNEFALKFQEGDEDQIEILKHEGAIVKALNGRPNIPKFETLFSTPIGTMLIMELLDFDLDSLRAKLPNQKYSISTWSRVCSQMLFGIKVIHDLGYVHRDLKPANFCAKFSDRQIKIIDFGLVRRFVDNVDSQPIFRIARPSAALRGTLMFTSINGHLGKELGRVDDVFSLMYSFSSLLKPLPWETIEESDVATVKDQCSFFRLFEERMIAMVTPEIKKTLESIEKVLKKADVYSFPPYAKIESFLRQVMVRGHVKWADKYDWESGKPKFAGPLGPWENPGRFFQSDRWQHLKVPGTK